MTLGNVTLSGITEKDGGYVVDTAVHRAVLHGRARTSRST